MSIPRDRNGNFSPALLPAYGRRDDHLEEMVIKLLSLIHILYRILKCKLTILWSNKLIIKEEKMSQQEEMKNLTLLGSKAVSYTHLTMFGRHHR